MADGLALFAHRQMILRVVVQTEVALQFAPVGMATFVKEETRQLKEAAFTVTRKSLTRPSSISW